jgi:adenylate cyclase
MNMSGDPEQEYIGDGISENITSTLSKISNMFVIASSSTFTYKGKPVKVQQVAEELGVHYVLEGSVQKAGERLRVTAQLIDALTGHHLWSEKYDRKMDDLFDLQDEITKKIVVSLEVVLTRGREIVIEARGTNNLEAWSKVAKGHTFWIRMTKEDNRLARKLFEEAARLDPNYASAWAWIGLSYCMDAEMRWSDSPFESWRIAQEAGQKALSIDDQNPQVFNMQGTIYLGQKEYDKAIAKIKEAIALEPNFDRAYYILGRTMFCLGRFEESIELIKKAMRFCPNYPMLYLNSLGRAYAWSARYNEEARAYMSEALKINPNLSLEGIERSDVFKNRAFLQRELLYLRKAGMPEKAPRGIQ